MEFRAPPGKRSALVEVTSFIGRRTELAKVKRLLGTHRLVTLTGAGGVGKTRIAVRVVNELSRRFADGVTWVELADLRDAALICQTIADRLNIADRIDHQDPLAALVHHLRDRSMLLVLDNVEHLVLECAHTVQELIRTCPGLRILVTSRQVLNIPGEHLFAVSPLPVPTEEQSREPGVGLAYSSLALFQERATASVGSFSITEANQQTVATICRKLEGIPLAIELATVKLRVLSVEQLAERLDDRLATLSTNAQLRNSRHATLQTAIDWSFELCTPQERLLWKRASIFVGGFDVEAAEACCSDDDLPRHAILNAIAGLVDKSILTRLEIQGRTRFRLLEPLREHGLDELACGGDTANQQNRHLDWCAELVNEACLQWFGSAQERWCVALKLEKANIRAAAEHCLTQPHRMEEALRLLGDPWFLWIALFLAEGSHWLERVLSKSQEPTTARAKALVTAGYIAAVRGRREQADKFLAESFSLGEAVAGTATLAYARHIQGLNLVFHDPAKAAPVLKEAIVLYETADDVLDDYVVALRIQLGLGLYFVSDLAGAADQFARCRELCTSAGEQWLLSWNLIGQTFVSYTLGELEDARSHAQEAVMIKRFFLDDLGLAVCIDLLGAINAALGNAWHAATLLGAASHLWASFDAPRLFGSDHWLAPYNHATEQITEALGPTRFVAAVAQGKALTRETALALAAGEVLPVESSQEPESVHLTPREREIAELVADGLSNKAIAQKLIIAQRTAESHVENILTKFGYHSRSQIAAWVAEHRVSS